jgi:2-iminobutanoate/2-iminopropanoate deaminase
VKREVISTDQAPAAIGPYVQAMKAEGTFLFMSGQIPLTPSGEMVEGGVEAQTHQVVANMRAVLAEAGLTPDSIVKTTIFLSSMDHFAAVNAIYAEMFTDEPPARATVAVLTLPKNVDVEIEAIAVC